LLIGRVYADGQMGLWMAVVSHIVDQPSPFFEFNKSALFDHISHFFLLLFPLVCFLLLDVVEAVAIR
jgi:hypothetical protein